MADYLEFPKGRRKRILDAVKSKADLEKVESLLSDIELFIKAVYNGETSYRKIDSSEQPWHQLFGESSSYEVASELDYRLNLLAEYQYSSFHDITNLLKTGLQPPFEFHLNRRQVSLIMALNEEPKQGIVALSRRLKVSPRSVKKDQQNLFNIYGFRIGAILNVQKFGLIHQAIYFRTRDADTSYKFENWLRQPSNVKEFSPFFLGYGFDLNHQDGYCSFFIPERSHSSQRIEKKIHWLEEQFLESYVHFTIKGSFSNTNFDCYDFVSGRWSISVDLRTDGTLQFIRTRGPQFSFPRGLYYSAASTKLDEIDWLLALMNCISLLNKPERVVILGLYGFPIAEKTVWAHERMLYRYQILQPTIMFSNLAFEDIICLIIMCDEQIVTDLIQLVTQYPYSRTYPTNNGAIFFIGVPVGASGLINHLTRILVREPGIHKFNILRLKRDIPQTPSLETYRLWNSKTQQWKNE